MTVRHHRLMAPLTADRHTANGNKLIISLACSNVVDYWQGVVPILKCLNDVHFDFFFAGLGRKMTGRWAGWDPSWKLCPRATKSTRWAPEAAEARKSITNEWNRVIRSLCWTITELILYTNWHTFQQISFLF
jgi:hypothetical protein